MQARFGRSAVGDRHVDGICGAIRLIQGHRQLFALGLELAIGPAGTGGNPRDLELWAHNRARKCSDRDREA